MISVEPTSVKYERNIAFITHRTLLKFKYLAPVPGYRNRIQQFTSKSLPDESIDDFETDANESQVGYHMPVMLDECCNYLNITQGKIFVDCTLGGGGHTREILKRGGTVIGLDQDFDSIQHALNDSELLSYIGQGQLEIIQSNFRSINTVVTENSLLAKNQLIDGVLMDLGVSSHQINEPTRGFSFGSDGPLDMRMYASNSKDDTTSAKYFINNLSVTELADILYQYGDETRSRQIARDIVLSRPLNTTQDLVNVISRSTSWKQRPKTLARCFQAFRIHVNDELGALKQALKNIDRILKPKGRLVVMSYHSLEDRLIKNLFKYGNVESSTEINADNPWKALTTKAITPTELEVTINRRSRSAKLRIGEKKPEIDEIILPKTISKYGSYIGKKQAAKKLKSLEDLSD